MEQIKHECGVIGIHMKDPSGMSDNDLLTTPDILIKGLSILQHRGQRSAGISIYRPHKKNGNKKIISTYKNVGKISEVFKLNKPEDYSTILKRCKGISGIGHTRYSTSGNIEDEFSALDETQPFERRHSRSWKKFSIAFNGNIANYDELVKEIEEYDYQLETNVDTEVLMNLISRNINLLEENSKKPDLFKVMEMTMMKLDGAYNIVCLFGDGDLVILRDPKGFRPLVIGENSEFYCVASESCALERVGITEFRDVLPGEVIILNEKGITSKIINPSRRSFCHFEPVYFSKGNSIMEGFTVIDVRKKLGEELAINEPLKEKINSDFLVVPAPMTAIPSAERYAQFLNLPFRHAIEKISTDRGFINPLLERKRIMSGNYIIHSDVNGKKILLIDDSIVRGETLARLVNDLKKKGAKEVHIRITEPMITCPCFYGVDFHSKNELISNKNNQNPESIGFELGADSLFFNSIESLVKSIGIKKEELCLACLNGEYPTYAGKKLFEKENSGF